MQARLTHSSMVNGRGRDMKRIHKRIHFAVLLLCLGIGSAAGQSQSVQQSGTVTANHLAGWVYNGIIGDAGTSTTPAISTLGIYGTGTPFCVSNTKVHTGQYYNLCLGYASNSSSASISLLGYGGASTIPLNININGTVYPIGGAGWLSSIIDSQIGSTQGDILYRNATVWTVLPAGTSGNLLATNGANGNPSWVAGTSLGSIAANSALANLTASAAAPTAAALPSCSTTGSFVQYTTNTGFSCGTGLNATVGTVTAASTTDLSVSTATVQTVSGNTTITSFGAGTNLYRVIQFTGTPLLTYNATTLITPTLANIQAAPGDVATLASDGSGNWRIIAYSPAGGSKSSTFTAASLTTSYSQVASISLMPGRWLLNGGISAGSATTGYVDLAISTTTASNAGSVMGQTEIYGAGDTVHGVVGAVLPTTEITLTATTTYYLNALVQANSTGYGGIFRATRVY